MKSALLVSSILAAVLFSANAFARDVIVSSHCPMTGVTGYGHGPTFDVAVDLAIKACIAKGGQAPCCYKFVRKLS